MGNPQLQILNRSLQMCTVLSMNQNSYFPMEKMILKSWWVFFVFVIHKRKRQISINEIVPVKTALIPRHSREGESRKDNDTIEHQQVNDQEH